MSNLRGSKLSILRGQNCEHIKKVKTEYTKGSKLCVY